MALLQPVPDSDELLIAVGEGRALFEDTGLVGGGTAHGLKVEEEREVVKAIGVATTLE